MLFRSAGIAATNIGEYAGVLDISNPRNLVGLVIGAAVVFLFSGLAINAVGRAAGAVVFEVRRQFRENPGIMTGQTKPEYYRVVDICTKDSLRELATPGLLAVMSPIAVILLKSWQRADIQYMPQILTLAKTIFRGILLMER